MTLDGSVRVGVDGTDASRRAVRWAAEEARLRGVCLHIVHAIDPDDDAGAYEIRTAATSPAVLALLDGASAIAQHTAPGLTVETDADVCPPAIALSDARFEPVLLCVGSAGQVAPHPGHRVSLTTEVLLAAACAVVVVRGPWAQEGWVVVEVGDGPLSADLLRAAVREASLRSLPLRVLTGSDVARDAAQTTREEIHRRIVGDLERYRRLAPDLDVVALPTVWTSEHYLSRYRNRIALYVAPARVTHDVGTVIHPDAERALALLSCPVMFNAELQQGFSMIDSQVRRVTVTPIPDSATAWPGRLSRTTTFTPVHPRGGPGSGRSPATSRSRSPD